MSNEILVTENLFSKVKNIIDTGRAKAFKVVNATIVESYWHIGKEIVEEEQNGENKADYGKYLINSISEKLTKEYGKGYSISSLKDMRQFYITFPISHALRGQLSWTHYRLLMRVKKEEIRNFYIIETVENNWSSRELDRQISSLLYERISMSKDSKKVKDLSTGGQLIESPSDIIKSPLIFEFLGKGDYTINVESDLESALMDKLQLFMLELGKGFSFVGRQKRISVDGDNYFIDLVFYN